MVRLNGQRAAQSGKRVDRLVAYTIGFSRPWRADWGGQLLLHDEYGDVERGFAPAFNTLTMFRVPRVHSVAPVAPYAGAPRFSVTGWLIRSKDGAAYS